MEGGLVHQVGEVGAAHARSTARDNCEVDVGADPFVLAVDLQDRQALFEVGERHDDLAVEAAGPEQRRVKDVRPVGRRHHDDALGRLEAVHFGQHLVEGLLPLVVAATEPSPTLAPDGVDLVDENDRRCLLTGALEQVAHPGGADPDEHFHEVRAGHRHERDTRFAGHGPRQEGLAGAWRADEEDALGDLGTDLFEAAGRTQEIDDLADLHLDPVVAGDVSEGGPRPFGRVHLGPATADRHDPAHLALGAPGHPEDEDEYQHAEEDVG